VVLRFSLKVYEGEISIPNISHIELRKSFSAQFNREKREKEERRNFLTFEQIEMHRGSQSY